MLAAVQPHDFVSRETGDVLHCQYASRQDEDHEFFAR